jgi:hypothetical protein
MKTAKLIIVSATSVFFFLGLVSFFSSSFVEPQSLEFRATETDERCGVFLEELARSYVPIQKDFVENRNGKALVYTCWGLCGGMGDRIRGITTAFLQAVLTNRAFFINHTSPAPLSEFFEFADQSISWEFNESLVTGMNFTDERFMDKFKIGKYRYRTENFHRTMKDQVHYLHINQPLQSYLTWNPHLAKELRKYHLDKVNYLDLPGCIMEYVLKPRGELKTMMENLSSRYLEQNNVIGIQVRTGGDGQWLNEPSRVPRSDLDYFWNCAKRIEDEELQGLPVKWFLTTDSEFVRNESIARFGTEKIFTIEGDIVHVDKTDTTDKRQASQGMLKTLTDLLLLSESNKLIVSRSNFAEIAALRTFKGAFVYPNNCTVEEETIDFTRWWHADAE